MYFILALADLMIYRLLNEIIKIVYSTKHINANHSMVFDNLMMIYNNNSFSIGFDEELRLKNVFIIGSLNYSTTLFQIFTVFLLYIVLVITQMISSNNEISN